MTLSTRRTPAMGWNSWNALRCYDVDEEAVLGNADALVELGLAEAGYDTAVLDDGWQAPTRARDGSLRADPRRFPSGIGALADEIHSRGLRFGLYLAPGRRTCAQYWDAYGWWTRRGAVRTPPAPVLALARTGRLPARPSGRGRRRDLGSWRREREDLEQLVSWGIDLLKYDWCRAECGTELCAHEGPFALMSHLIGEQEREIHYSISEYGDQEPWRWAPGIAHSWRTTPDISRSASSILSIARATAEHAAATGPGRVQDPDMLQVGNLASTTLDRTHLLLWSMLAAPLMIGCDLRGRDRDDPAVQVLRDEELVAIDQDPRVSSARHAGTVDGAECFVRRLGTGTALALVNPEAHPRTVTMPELPDGADVRRLVVDGRVTEPHAGRIDLPAHGSALLRA